MAEPSLKKPKVDLGEEVVTVVVGGVELRSAVKIYTVVTIFMLSCPIASDLNFLTKIPRAGN